MEKPIVHAFFLCYNEANILPHLLKHYLSFCEHVTILDNNSTDNTEEVAQSYSTIWPFFTYATENDRWLSNARNTGSKLASGEFLIFLDDDVIVPPTYLDRVFYVKNNFYM